MMSVFNKRREFVRFILVGVLATATHYGIYFFLCVLMLPAIAYTIGYAISFILNFYLSNIFTFNTKPTVRKGIGFGISHFINYFRTKRTRRKLTGTTNANTGRGAHLSGTPIHINSDNSPICNK